VIFSPVYASPTLLLIGLTFKTSKPT
jgi:hypothetical protein